MSEFSVIDEFFTIRGMKTETPVLGIGDDCAVVDIPEGYQLAISTDTLVEGVHFLAGTAAEKLGHKSLAVNLSDLAAMGARPAYATLAITLPFIDKTWLGDFSKGFFDLASQYNVSLMGGDTTQGPLSITLTVFGFLPKEKRLLRSAARVGDDIYVSGSIGLAGLGLIMAKNETLANDVALERFYTPMPQVELGQSLLHVAHAAIDVSDGLFADLSHILKASRVGAEIDVHAIPVATSVRLYAAQIGEPYLPFNAGDDYELCFTVSPDRDLSEIQGVTKIGRVIEEEGLFLLDKGRNCYSPQGFEHFK